MPGFYAGKRENGAIRTLCGFKSGVCPSRESFIEREGADGVTVFAQKADKADYASVASEDCKFHI